MIAQIRGRLASKEPHRVVVDVNGVGYQLFIPLSTYYQLPEVPAEVFLHTHTHVREDALQLFGFHTRDEQSLFELLQGVSGIGPRLATNILSGISVDELVPALSDGNHTRLWICTAGCNGDGGACGVHADLRGERGRPYAD